MAKFEIELELTGFKLKIRGEREDVPLITQNIGQQIAGLLQPAGNIVEGTVTPNMIDGRATPSAPAGEKVKRTRTRRATTPSNGDASPTIMWSHNPDKWGNPRQEWKSTQKIVWLLYVADQEKQIKEMTAPQIVETFNRQFRQANTLNPKNMSRDLASLKQRVPPHVGESPKDTKSYWFLTEAGTKEAIRLVSEAKGGDLLQQASTGTGS